jgi:hypothetical protein
MVRFYDSDAAINAAVILFLELHTCISRVGTEETT